LRLLRSPRARPYLLIALLVDTAFIFVFLVAIQSYLPEQHGGGPALTGYILAAYGAAKLVAQLFGGRLTDRIGARRGLFVGLSLIVAAQVAFLAAALLPGAALPAATVYGLGSAVLWPALYALASATFAVEERARLTSGLTISTGFALVLGLGLGLALPAGFPYAAAIAIALSPVALALAVARAVFAQSTEDRASLEEQATGSLRTVMKGFLEPKRIGFSIVMLLQATALGALLAVFRSYGRDVLGVSLREEALFLAPAAVLAAAAILLGGILSDRLGRIPLLGTGFLIAGLAIWALSTVSGPLAAAPVAAAVCLGLGLALPSVGAMSMDMSRAAGRGTTLGWFLTMEGLGHAIGPAIGGWVSASASTTAVLWLVGGLFACISLVAFLPPMWESLSISGISTPHRGNRRFLAGLAKGGLVLTVGLPVLTTYWAWTPSSQVYGRITTHGPRDQMVVTLTFDDGPNDPWTSRIADVLDQYGVKATFFVVGKNADARPEIVRDLVQRGHLVGNHSYHHRKRDAIFQLRYSDLREAERSIARAAGVCPAFFRPPNGFHTPWQLDAVSDQHMRTLTWDVIAGDWKRPPPKEIVRRVLNSVRPGSIVLLHDGDDTNQGTDRSPTLEALPSIIEGLRAKGYRLVRLDELLSTPAYLPACDGAVEYSQ